MIRDIRFALRALMRTPVFTTVCVLMLAVGIGSSIYMFGAINAFALKPLPFADPDRLVHFEYTDQRDTARNLALPIIDWLDLRDRQTSLQSLAAYYQGTANLAGIDGAPERLSGAWVSADAFPVLGVQPLLGRGFDAADQHAGAARVVLIGHRLWQLRFNADPQVIGRTLRINGEPAAVVGVMPEGFAFPVGEAIWMPLPDDRAEAAAGTHVKTFGRLRDGVSFAQARQQFDALMAALAAERGASLRGDQAKLEAFSDEFIMPQIRDSTNAMFVAVLLVLLIACANVAALVLARFAARTRELGIRSALGASRGRLIIQVLTETFVLAAVAALLGYAGADLVARANDSAMSADANLPYWVDFSVDGRDLVFSAAIALLAAVLAGLVPALRAGRIDVQASLRGGSNGSIGAGGRLGRFLVSGEVALCVVLLVCAGVAIRSALHAQQAQLGIVSEGVLTGRIALFESNYADDAARLRFVEALDPPLRELPGVQTVAFASTLPLMGYERQEYARVGDAVEPDARLPQAYASRIGNEFFQTFGIALREGRLFDARDRAGAPQVAIVSAGFAAAAWPQQGAIGQRVQLSPKDPGSPWLEVVGVVADSSQADHLVASTTSPSYRGHGNVFRPIAQSPPAFVSFALRADGDIAALATAVRAAVRAVDADLPVYWLQPMDDWRRQIFWGSELLARMFGAFAVFAVLLAAAGIYAVLAFDVASRTREIGVRRALGAQAASVLGMVLRRGGLQVLAGFIVGMPVAIAFSMLLDQLMMPGSRSDPLVYVVVLGVLTCVVLAAAMLPARRALRVDPIVALRND